MYIINYKGLDKGYNTGLSISRNVKEGYYSYLSDEFKKCKYLIPERDFEGKVESEEQIREYIRSYYINVLSKLDPKEVYDELGFYRLVTFDDGEFSHGYIVSAWFELFLDVKVPCVNKNELYNRNLKDIKPRWVIDVLEEEIKKTIDNMRGFNSVRALYLFHQGEELERMADELENRVLDDKSLSQEQVYKLSDTANGYRQCACFRRCDADMAEDAWRERRYKLIEESKKRSRKK